MVQAYQAICAGVLHAAVKAYLAPVEFAASAYALILLPYYKIQLNPNHLILRLDVRAHDHCLQLLHQSPPCRGRVLPLGDCLESVHTLGMSSILFPLLLSFVIAVGHTLRAGLCGVSILVRIIAHDSRTRRFRHRLLLLALTS